MKSHNRHHRARAVTVLVSSVVGLSLAAWNAHQYPSEQLILIALASVIVPDRIADVLASFNIDFEDEERQKILDLIKEHFGSLSTYLLNAHDIVTFPTRREGLEHCIYLAKHASHIRNTALRYSAPSSLGDATELDDVDKVYLDWIEAKKQTLRRGYNVTEIISKYFAPNDPLRRFAAEENSAHYDYRLIDDVANPMMQLTLFEFEGRRPAEIVMGWEIPGKEEGLAFASRHRNLVEYFEAYFNHNFNSNADTVWAVPSVPKLPAVADGDGSEGAVALMEIFRKMTAASRGSRWASAVRRLFGFGRSGIT